MGDGRGQGIRLGAHIEWRAPADSVWNGRSSEFDSADHSPRTL